LFASCASAPQKVTDYADASREFGVLDGGGLLYFSVDVPAARPLLDRVSIAGASGKEAAQILDRTETAAGAAYPPASGRRFLLSARGRYPKSGANFALGMSSAWEKRKSGKGLKYWYSGKQGLSIFLNRRYALVSDGELFAPPGQVTVPEAFWQMREGAAFAGWLEDAAVLIDRFLEQSGIPLQIPADHLIFAVFPAEDPLPAYIAILRLETPSVSHAKALASMVSMIRPSITRPPADGSAAVPPLLAALFANAPVQENTALILKTAVLDADAIALLFTLFSVNSDQNPSSR
jgi:hypothetical protein